MNLLSRIIIAFLLAYLVIMTIAAYIAYREESENLMLMKEQEIRTELNGIKGMLDILQDQRSEKVVHSFSTAKLLIKSRIKTLEIDSSKQVFFRAVNQKTGNTTEITVPVILLNGEQLQYSHELVDEIRDLTGSRATVFQKFNKGYLRISTNITGKNSRRATGTYIPHGTKVSEALNAGNEFSGKAYVVGQFFHAKYKPLRITDTDLYLFVGDEIKDLKDLQSTLTHNNIFQTGNPLIISADQHSKGKVLLGRRYKGQNWTSVIYPGKSEFFFKLKQNNGDKVSKTDFVEPGKDFYYTFYEPLNMFIGISIPDDYLLGDLRSTLWKSIMLVFGISLIVALIILYIGTKHYSRKLGNTINSIDTLSKGDIPSGVNNTEIPELVRINRAVEKLSENIRNTTEFARNIGRGKLDADYQPLSKNDVLGHSLINMRDNLAQMNREQQNNSWLQKSTVRILKTLRQEHKTETAAEKFLLEVAEILDIQVGALYLFDSQTQKLKLYGTYGFSPKPNGQSEFHLGEGIVGQAAKEGKLKIYKDIDPDYVQVKVSMGAQTPKQIIAVPFSYHDQLVGVIEVGTLVENIKPVRYKLVSHLSESVAATFYNIQINQARKKLLGEVEQQKIELQKKTSELQEKHKELEQTNEELKSQAAALEESESNLETQQEELRVSNEKLEHNLKESQRQKAEINEKNIALENIRDELERKAQELETASRFKSEFLANMSHELRTPLNSLLILAQTMAENDEGNLNEEQVETMEIIYNSGKDLLNLINDILDLSKIEAGKMDVEFNEVDIAGLMSNLRTSFAPSAKQKNIAFRVYTEKGAPESIRTDKQRMEQILRNLLSNAMKFTSKGKVEVRFFSPSEHEGPAPQRLKPDESIGISVIDTGTGIKAGKTEAIFEAFQQEDSSISRKFGGTGLGLSISRELSIMLGGEITLQSEYGKGTTFNLFLPLDEKYKASYSEPSQGESGNQASKKSDTNTAIEEPQAIQPDDDRFDIDNQDHVLEIIEDDISLLKTLTRLARRKGFKVIATNTGEEGLRLCKKHKPAAILLDIKLPGIDGFQVLDELKSDTATQHIPVHILSGLEDEAALYREGAWGYLKKPASREQISDVIKDLQGFIEQEIKKLLIVEDDRDQRRAITKLLKSSRREIKECSSAEEAYDIIKLQQFDAIILDLKLEEMTGTELLEKLAKEDVALPPVIIYTGRDLSKEETEKLEKYAQSIIIKGSKSQERLLDETSLFMHSVISELPPSRQQMIRNLRRSELFRGKRVLLVDDDIRNLMVLNRILEDKGFETKKAKNGKKALEALEKDNEFDIILMDIMMPVMDGFEAISKIKSDPRFKHIPVIAITAKGMKGDRERVMKAGADDYMVKPVDINNLLTTIKIWLQNN